MAPVPKQQPIITLEGGLRLPKDRLQRPRRPIPGLDDAYAVTQCGRVYSAELNEVWDADQWPRIWLPKGDNLFIVDVVAAVAMVWLDEAQRATIRHRIPVGTRHDDPAVLPFVQEFSVTKHAVVLVANKPDSGIAPVRLDGGEATGEILTLKQAVPTDYITFLYEPSRPPSQGGNTSALHVHTMVIDGQKYSFFARGSRKWVYVGDRVSFSFRLTDKGYRNVIRTSIVTQDKTGRPVERGDRRAKQTLRTTKTRLPAKRSEWRD